MSTSVFCPFNGFAGAHVDYETVHYKAATDESATQWLAHHLRTAHGLAPTDEPCGALTAMAVISGGITLASVATAVWAVLRARR